MSKKISNILAVIGLGLLLYFLGIKGIVPLLAVDTIAVFLLCFSLLWYILLYKGVYQESGFVAAIVVLVILSLPLILQLYTLSKDWHKTLRSMAVMAACLLVGLNIGTSLEKKTNKKNKQKE